MAKAKLRTSGLATARPKVTPLAAPRKQVRSVSQLGTSGTPSRGGNVGHEWKLRLAGVGRKGKMY